MTNPESKSLATAFAFANARNLVTSTGSTNGLIVSSNPLVIAVKGRLSVASNFLRRGELDARMIFVSNLFPAFNLSHLPYGIIVRIQGNEMIVIINVRTA